jgi:hypothetical protein
MRCADCGAACCDHCAAPLTGAWVTVFVPCLATGDVHVSRFCGPPCLRHFAERWSALYEAAPSDT